METRAATTSDHGPHGRGLSGVHDLAEEAEDLVGTPLLWAARGSNP